MEYSRIVMTTLSSVGGRERATMRDVAALAQVSLKTVSRVVNHESGVSEELVARVTRAAEQLDYRPNLTASNLRRADGRTATIGLLVDDVANPFFADIHRGVEEVARERGVAVMAASLDRRDDLEGDIVRTFASRRVDGLLLVPTAKDQAYLATELRSGWPVVCVDRTPVGVSVDVVLSDNRDAARAATQHLISHGHRRIAVICDASTLMTARDRLDGYRDAMRSAGIGVDDSIIRVDVESLERSDEAVRSMLAMDAPPTAIFAAQNYVTMGACRALHHLGLQQRIALVGFDDFPMADVLDPGVTVVAQHARRMGHLAAEALFQRMDGVTGSPTMQVVESVLIPRGSGEIPPQ